MFIAGPGSSRAKTVLFAFAALAAFVATGCHREQPLRVETQAARRQNATLRFMTYNILNSGETKQKDVENRGEIIRGVIARLHPDVLGLNECNNWHHDNAALLRKYGARFDMAGILALKHGLNVVLLVKRNLPILQVLTDTTRQRHGLIVAEIGAPDGRPIKVFVTHMDPFSPKARLKELREILRYVGPGERCVIMGDLNSISPHDDAKLDEVPQKQRKRFTTNGKIDTRLIEGIEKAGFLDAYRLKHPHPSEKDRTVGTAISTDPAHAKAHLRLDYIFVTANLKDAVKSVEIVNDEETNRASDHFPVVMDLQL